MATFRASNTLSAATRTNSTLTKPTGTASGDLLVMFFNIESDVLPQPPSGWRFGYNIDHSGAAVDQWIFWKRAGASEPASYTITHSSTWTNGYIVAVQNVSQTVNPSFSAPAQGTGTTATANSVTSVGADAWIGFFVNTFGDQGAATPPSGSTPTFTERYESTNNIYAADGTLASAGSTGTKSITFAASQQWMATMMVVEDSATTGSSPFVVQPAYAALASANPSVTFDVPVLENDVVVMWATSTTVATVNADPTGWVNVLGSTVRVASDSHSAACVYHQVTAAEALAQTLAYTCTGLFTASQTGTVLGALVRNVDPTTPLDSAASTFSSTNTATPHVLAGLTGANVGDGSIVLSAVAKDATGAYSTLPSGWEFLVSYNTNQGSALFRREDNTTAGVAVAATNVTPSAGDEYVSITVALTPAPPPGTTLAPSDTAHGHTTDAVVITQTHVLAGVADTAHGNTADAVAITQTHILAGLADTAHGHTTDALTIAIQVTLAPADTAHGHTTDAVTISQTHALTVADTAHGNTADAVVISQTHRLTVADTAHGHTTDAVTISQTHRLTVADTAHAHTTDAVVISLEATLAPNDTAHAHTTDAVTISQTHVLVVADTAHGHTTENVTIGSTGTLAPADTAHAHTTDAVTISQTHRLTVADSSHGHTTENVTIGAAGTDVLTGLADTAHAHTSESVVISQTHRLTVADSSHAHTTDAVTLTQTHVLIVAGSDHGHTTDTVTVTQVHVLVVDDSEHRHTVDTVVFEGLPGRVTSVVAAPGATSTVTAAAARSTVTLSADARSLVEA